MTRAAGKVEPTNASRADDAFRTLLTYEQRTGRDHGYENIRDLISDLLHLAVQGGLSPEDECESALLNFKDEAEEAACANLCGEAGTHFGQHNEGCPRA